MSDEVKEPTLGTCEFGSAPHERSSSCPFMLSSQCINWKPIPKGTLITLTEVLTYQAMKHDEAQPVAAEDVCGAIVPFQAPCSKAKGHKSPHDWEYPTPPRPPVGDFEEWCRTAGRFHVINLEVARSIWNAALASRKASAPQPGEWRDIALSLNAAASEHAGITQEQGILYIGWMAKQGVGIIYPHDAPPTQKEKVS